MSLGGNGARRCVALGESNVALLVTSRGGECYVCFVLGGELVESSVASDKLATKESSHEFLASHLSANWRA